jgi:uncharacterized protein YutE (UPF0331/DUF86 family)
MVDRDVILAKAAAIDRALARISDVRTRRGTMNAEDVEELLELNLQRAVQSAIDLSAHVVATERYGLPDSVAATFTLLQANGVISQSLAERLRRMAGFRNIAVHAYETIDPTIIESLVEERLGDLRELAAAVVNRFGLRR